MQHFVLIRETWSHMNEVSGFDPLFALLAERKDIISQSFFVNEYQNHHKNSRWKRLFKKNKSVNINGAYSPFVEQKHERLAREVITSLNAYSQSIVLLSVCENQFAPAFAKLPDNLLNNFVLFVHQPPAWFRLHWKNFAIFSKVKAVVCLCNAQVDFFKGYGVKQIIQIRHGVNLEFFKPQPIKITAIKKILFVGQWLRDVKTLSKAFYSIEQNMPDIELHCVVPQRNRMNNEFYYRLAQSNKVFWYDQISSNDLLDLYHMSHCLLLPLIDATANNALNEALACGLPIITTNIGGTIDYVYEPNCKLVKAHDADDLANQCLAVLNNLTIFQNLQHETRSHAELNLNWNNQVNTILTSLLS